MLSIPVKNSKYIWTKDNHCLVSSCHIHEESKGLKAAVEIEEQLYLHASPNIFPANHTNHLFGINKFLRHLGI